MQLLRLVSPACGVVHIILDDNSSQRHKVNRRGGGGESSALPHVPHHGQ
uniref:Uncharacterized protein n=1 Tax=Arundo donax TaxID=35708 RepID=A0A0A9BV07_ARUDO